MTLYPSHTEDYLSLPIIFGIKLYKKTTFFFEIVKIVTILYLIEIKPVIQVCKMEYNSFTVILVQ